jgi:anti-sigma regulatory factor (Ser/Thr protein kinase)
LELEFPASPAHLSEVRKAVRAGLLGRVPDRDLDDLLLALNEATTNAVLHGSGGGRVEVSVRVDQGWVEMTVLDRGPDEGHGPSWRLDGEDWANPNDRVGPNDRVDPDDGDEGDAAAAISGRGLWLMGRLVDEVRLEQVRPGTRITLRRRLSNPGMERGLTV